MKLLAVLRIGQSGNGMSASFQRVPHFNPRYVHLSIDLAASEFGYSEQWQKLNGCALY
jgi:hypothetical protein